MYFPDKSRPEVPPGVEVVSVKTEDDLTLQGWFFPLKSETKGTIVYFHGNAGNIKDRLFKIIPYLENGYEVLLCEYREYGGNPGEMSEQGAYADARAYLNWISKRPEIDQSKIFYYGESIGTGVAVQMASERIPSVLVLESPFSSALDLAKIFYFFLPVDFLLKDRFLSSEKIASIKVRLLIVHGDKDDVIPISLAKKLFALAHDPKRFVEIRGGNHNNLPLLGLSDHVLEFLAGEDSVDLDNRESSTPKELK